MSMFAHKNSIDEEKDSENSSPADFDRLQRKLKRLEAEYEQLSKVHLALIAKLDAITNSRSWKLAEKLQRLKKSLQPMLQPLRFSSFTPSFQPLRDSVSDSRGGFLLDGLAPSFQLINEGRNPNRWVDITAQISGDFDHLHCYLYYDSGDGFQGDKRALLQLEKSKPQRFLMRLPDFVLGLRLDPFEAKGVVKFESFAIRELGSLQVALTLFKSHILPLLFKPRQLKARLLKAVQMYRSGGLAALRIRLFDDSIADDYQEWMKRFAVLSETDKEQAQSLMNTWESPPLLSVMMPVYNPPLQYLEQAIESVLSQWYPNWELCIADDASTDSAVKEILREYAGNDKRIKLIERTVNGHISAASNSALDLCTGSWTCLLDHDDVLAPHALLVVAEKLVTKPSLRLLYSDEDKVSEHGLFFNPYFKSGWNPFLLWSQNYICHLTVLHTESLKAIGGFRQGVEGAQDWDVVLRMIDHCRSLGFNDRDVCEHIPHVLYHWRVFAGSTAQSTDAKPYVLEAQRKVVADHLERSGITGGDVSIRHDISQLRVELPIPSPAPLVSLIIPTRDKLKLLQQCVDSIIRDTTYPNYEIIIVDNGSVEDETLAYFSRLTASYPNVSVLRDEGEFNFSRLNNVAVRQARGSLVGLINNDLEVIEKRWLDELVSYAVLPQCGAVGARLYFPNGLLQHGGVILGIGGIAGHSHKGILRSNPGQFNRAILPQCLSAVTAACLVVRKELYEQVGGLDEVNLKVAFNDVDFCLRLQEAGYLNVYNPYAELWHHESASRGLETTVTKFARFEGEIDYMKERWSEVLSADPFYNPNLTLLGEDFSYAYPPRKDICWRQKPGRGLQST
jgi:O-antigen biosynthesis protein